MGTTLVGEAVGIREGLGDGRNEGARLREGRAVGAIVGGGEGAVGIRVGVMDGAVVGLRDGLTVPEINSRAFLLFVSGRSRSLVLSIE